MSVTSLFASVSFGLLVPKMVRIGKEPNRVIAYTGVLFLLIIIMFDISQNLLPSEHLPRNKFEEQVRNIDNETGCECWWPIWARKEGFENKERANAGSRKTVITEWSSESRELIADAGEVNYVRIATFFHPYWTATVNGEAVSVEKDQNGAILVPLPDMSARVHLSFKEPGFLTAARIVSLIVWLLFVVFTGIYFRKFRRDRNVGY
jgi:hypothetical protein